MELGKPPEPLRFTSEITGQPRSYQVVTEDGSVLRRNRQHLRATAEPLSISPSVDDIPEDSHEDV
ncbi:hypothetical protein HPB50_009399 [Hyalomma asiaticum]|uniref:Uncharacterized protein n=1 Tax=Hyalomma asiaticum TaxID=266040 RepID=A0ACB7SDT0_HYAAI|nr:hypothetical protein HPB50_009399 [Hyalomma asiaticum]